MLADGPVRPSLHPRGPGRRLVSLLDEVVVEYTDPYRADAPVVAHAPWGPVDLGPQDGSGRSALWRMSLGPVDPVNVHRDTRTPPGLEDLFARLGDVVVHSLAPADGSRPLLSVVPLVRGARFAPAPVDPDVPVRLRADVVLVRRGAGLAAECPPARFRVELHRSLAICVTALLAAPWSVAALAAGLGDDGSGLVSDVTSHLLGAGVVAPEAGPTATRASTVGAPTTDRG